jgi:hypothetical protein
MEPDPVRGQLDLVTAQILGFDEPVEYLAFEAADGTLFAWSTRPSSHRMRGGQGQPDRPLFYAFELRPNTETVRLAQTLGFGSRGEARRWAGGRWAQAEGRTASRQARGAQPRRTPHSGVPSHPEDGMDDASDQERATNEGRR